MTVVKLHAVWSPWRLTMTVAQMAAVTSGTKAPSPGIKPGDTWSYPTSNLRILPPPGENLSFDVAVGFLDTGVVAALFMHGETPDPGATLAPPPDELAGAPSNANTLADGQYGFVNKLLGIYAPAYQFPLNFQGVSQSLRARDVSVSGGDNLMDVNGRVELGGLAYTGVIHCSGDDLAVRDVQLEAPAAACNSDDMLEQIKCQARGAAMAGSSSALSNALTNYYQGQKLNYYTGARPLVFTLGEVEFSAAFEGLKASSHGSTISEYGRSTIRRVSSQP
jgi:hypothetical protein